MQRKVGITAIAIAALGVIAATVAGKFEYWLDFVQLSRAWELSLLSSVIDRNIDPEVHSRPTDGYNTAIMDGYAANLTFVSLTKSVQTIFQLHLDPIIMGRVGRRLDLRHHGDLVTAPAGSATPKRTDPVPAYRGSLP